MTARYDDPGRELGNQQLSAPPSPPTPIYDALVAALGDPFTPLPDLTPTPRGRS